MSVCIDMSKLRHEIYLTDAQKEAMGAALRPPSFADQLKMRSVDALIAFLRNQAMQMKLESSPHCKNIQPIDVDMLAVVYDVLADRLAELTASPKPARNCDRFSSGDAAQIAFLNEVWLISVTKETMLERDKFENWTDERKTLYAKWLFAPAKKEGGDKS